MAQTLTTAGSGRSPSSLLVFQGTSTKKEASSSSNSVPKSVHLPKVEVSSAVCKLQRQQSRASCSATCRTSSGNQISATDFLLDSAFQINTTSKQSQCWPLASASRRRSPLHWYTWYTPGFPVSVFFRAGAWKRKPIDPLPASPRDLLLVDHNPEWLQCWLLAGASRRHSRTHRRCAA